MCVMKRTFLIALLSGLSLLSMMSAALRMPPVFTSGMVLQRDMPVRIWGEASPLTAVTVRFGGQKQRTLSDADGHWQLSLLPMAASTSGRTLSVTSGKESLVLDDVLVGEVWLASGQSNMEYNMEHAWYRQDILKAWEPAQGPNIQREEWEKASAPMMRTLFVERCLSTDTLPTIGWKTIDQKSLRPMTAVGYFFAKNLIDSLQVPVGIINASWGGTPIQAWTNGEQFQHMIRPLVPFTIRGCLWYQGEANLQMGETDKYASMFRQMVSLWRQLWSNEDLPFYTVQLAPFAYSQARDRLTSLDITQLPRFREVQDQCSLSMSGVSMVVTTDLCDNLNDIHPTYKWVIGNRLARQALARTYHKSICSEGPRMTSFSVNGDELTVHFDSHGGSLKTSDGKAPTCFQVAGRDGRFRTATISRISGNDIILSASKVANPCQVRFAWDEAARPNLYNAEGLPAYPFCSQPIPVEPRLRQTFDFDWQFSHTDTTNWEAIQLPHDWSTTLNFSRANKASHGYLGGGIGWYRKLFTPADSLQGRRLSLLFDGVMMNATVWINGDSVCFHQYGFTPFEVDLNSRMRWGQDNEILVRVDHTEFARWYTGSGIYRHVWLQAVSPVHVATYGTYITTPKVTELEAEVSSTITLQNTTAAATTIELRQHIIDAEGNVVSEPAISSLILQPGDSINASQQLSLVSPHLWDIDHPYRYQMVSTVTSNGILLDRVVTPFGVRTIEFSPIDGFRLNGHRLKLQGMCLHQDMGCLGAAIPDRGYEFRLKVLKDFGTNAIRCSHNPPAPEFLECCDSLGLLVIDEAFDKWKGMYYAKWFDQNWRQDMTDMISRDRNHPSIILWSIGNELDEARLKTDEGVERATMLRDFVHQYEPSRLTMLAVQPYYNKKFAAVTDVVGYNYVEPDAIADKVADPSRMALISESYPYYSNLRTNESRDYEELNPWNYVMQNDFICGSFMWAGADYLGESSGWPSKGWPTGPFDMMMHEKPVGGYFRTVWKSQPHLSAYVVEQSLDIDPGKDHWGFPGMVHDWTFPYTDKRILRVCTPTNCDSVILIDTRGKKYGPRSPRDYRDNTIIWNQPYRPGKLLFIGYKDGQEVCRDSLVTTGTEAASFTLKSERQTLHADGQDLAFVELQLLDAEGRPLRVDDRRVSVRVVGEGRLLGLNSGEMRRDDPLVSPTLPTYMGKAQIVVQSGRSEGWIRIHVMVDGLGRQILSLRVAR